AIPVAEKTETASPENEVRSTMLLLKTSATNVIPTGESHPAACMVSMPPCHTVANNLVATNMPMVLLTILIIRWVTVLRQKNSSRMAVNRCTTTGKTMVLSIIYLLLPVCSNHQGHPN